VLLKKPSLMLSRRLARKASVGLNDRAEYRGARGAASEAEEVGSRDRRCRCCRQEGGAVAGGGIRSLSPGWSCGPDAADGDRRGRRAVDEEGNECDREAGRAKRSRKPPKGRSQCD
jgi:hypothetical protein